jgi:RES domain-containing protein
VLTVWRLVTRRYARSAFSGEGARLYGGRWNPKGVRVVYTSESQSLALLEMLVQDEPLRARYVTIAARIPKALRIEHVRVEDLPPGWRSRASRERLAAIGADWLRRAASAVLAVPSAVIPAETNYLLNPVHAEFRRIATGKAQELVTDLRLRSATRPAAAARASAAERR